VSFHYSRLETSRQLQRLYAYLQRHTHKFVTTRELSTACRLEAVSTWISALNKNLEARGEHVNCKYMGETRDGGKLYGYILVGAKKEEAVEQVPLEDDNIPF
jgi:hypothetical protein